MYITNRTARNNARYFSCGARHIAAVTALSGKGERTVTAVGDNTYGQCDTWDWRNIMAVACGEEFTLGLMRSGRVVVAGRVPSGFDVSDWHDVTCIAAGSYHAAAVSLEGESGQVFATGANLFGECDITKKWRYINELACGIQSTLGVDGCGMVFSAGNIPDDENDLIKRWKNKSSVDCRGNFAAVQNGKVKVIGENDFGQCDTEDWTDIVQVRCSLTHTVGLRSDGTVAAAGDNETGQCNISEWRDILALSANNGITAGLRNDGVLLLAGNPDLSKYTISGVIYNDQPPIPDIMIDPIL